MKPDYVYVVVEESGDPSLVKIGHSINPVDRIGGYKAGNHRRLIVIFTLLGGQQLETDIHETFADSRVGNGGDEWYKITPQMIEFFNDRIKQVLTKDTILVYHKRYFGSPSNIPTIELGEVKTAPIKSVLSVDSVQPHGIVEASQPKSPYSKVGQKKEKQ